MEVRLADAGVAQVRTDVGVRLTPRVPGVHSLLEQCEHPDVILMDLEMPVIDRWEAVRRLKKDPQTRDIPIIGMSAHALASEREQAIATGRDEFDAKPIEFEHLVATIRRVLASPK